MTGTIFPDFARVTTGNDTPAAKARDVKAFAQTWVAPESANILATVPPLTPLMVALFCPTK